MPNSDFLETYPLYRKYEMDVPELLHANLEKPTISMRCRNEFCKDHETRPFKMINEYYDRPTSGFNMDERYKILTTTPIQIAPLSHEYRMYLQIMNSKGAIAMALYRCTSCEIFTRVFVLRFSPELDYVQKIGQFPEWDISLSKELEKNLRDYKDLYQKGLVCESHSYGIGAYSYYRRIIENIIDELLISIQDIIENEEKKNEYNAALENIKNTHVTEEKIELVKDLLPDILRPGGHNPLSLLHSLLSQGLHGKTDEQCLKDSQTIRNIIEFLSTQIAQSKNSAKVFTDSMEKILDKKSKQKKPDNK